MRTKKAIILNTRPKKIKLEQPEKKVSEDKVVVGAYIKKTILPFLQQDAEEGHRTISSQIAMMIEHHYTKKK